MPKNLSPHVDISEYKCRCCGALPPNFMRDGEMSIEFTVLFRCFETVREILGGNPIPIGRGYSCPNHELQIYTKMMRDKYGDDYVMHIAEILKAGTGITPYSTHIFGLALDVSPKVKDIENFVRAARVFKPTPRIGWKAYLKNDKPHCHIDFGFLIEPAFSLSLKSGIEW